MVSMKEEAENYKAPETANIADLQKVSVSIDIESRVFKKDTPDEFSVKVGIVDGVAYRIPLCVFKDLKTLLSELPQLKFVKVVKKGVGMNTEYTVIPLGV